MRYRKVEQVSSSDVLSRGQSPSETIGPKPTDWAFLAGYVDGEGCVYISGKGSCTLETSSVDPHVLRWIVSVFGGDIKLMNLKDRRSLYRWRIHGSSLRQMIPHLLPYSKIKKDQLASVVEFYDYPIGSTKRAKILENMKRKKRYDFGKSRTPIALKSRSD